MIADVRFDVRYVYSYVPLVSGAADNIIEHTQHTAHWWYHTVGKHYSLILL